MKVYVDELPKSCGDCVFCKQTEYYYYCDKLHTKLSYLNKEKDCPLQSLADNNKQVRKKTIDDLAISLISSFSKDAEFTVEEICKWLQKVKDQIQGENNVKD